MALENDDITLVLQELLNEIQPLREQLEMMVAEERSDNEEFSIAQLEAMKEKKKSIDDLFLQMDSIIEAEADEQADAAAGEQADAASSGGRRKTKRRRNKKKRKTKRKRRRRRKK